MLIAGDVGHRVVVRRSVGFGPHGRPLASDLLGDLLEIDDERLVVRTDDGSQHVVARTDVVAAKRIPPRPVRYSEIVALERVADAAWPAPVHERLGDWFLRAAEGFTGRANSALPLGDAGMPLGDAVDACTGWYRRHGLTPRIAVPLPLRRDVATVLGARGWTAQPLVLVQVARLTDVLRGGGADMLGAGAVAGRAGAAIVRGGAAEPAAPTAGPVVLAASPSPEFLQIITARKQGLPPSAHHVLCAVPKVRFAEVRDGRGALLAIARGAVVDGWLHVGLVEVVEIARRRGLGGRMTAELVSWAVGLGATRAVLQVEELNVAAVGLYGRLGFTTHHRYVVYALERGASVVSRY